jgi:hypothetical protein
VGSEPVPVKATGTIRVETNFDANNYYECRIRDGEAISNPTGGRPGIGETLAVRIGCQEGREPGICGAAKFKVIPRRLPWHSHLAFEQPNRVNDVFEGVALEIRCGKSPRGVFSGTWHAVIERSELHLEEYERSMLSNGSEQLYFRGGEALKGMITAA